LGFKVKPNTHFPSVAPAARASTEEDGGDSAWAEATAKLSGEGTMRRRRWRRRRNFSDPSLDLR